MRVLGSLGVDKIKNIETFIFISPNWDVEFHVHKNASLLTLCDTLAQNLMSKHDQLVVYVYKFLNITERKYSTTKREALAMVFVFHKFKHYLFDNKFVFYVDHMAFVITLTSGL